MIDFRYHLVSLISVFLALAVGIVLGAGPLQQPIGDSLQSQVEALRTDRDNLRIELDEARGDIGRLDEYITASAPELLADTLPYTSVTVVAGAEANADSVTALGDRLAESGATTASSLQLSESALDVEGAEALLESLREIDPDLPADDGEALVTALGTALGTPAAPEAGDDEQATAPAAEPTESGDAEDEVPGGTGYDVEEATAVIAAFADEGRVGGGEFVPGQAVVFVAPATPDAPEAADGASAAPTDEAAEAEDPTAAPEHALALLLGERTTTVVAGTTESAERGLVSGLRSADAPVTTVDSLELSAGPVITVLAVEESLAGTPGAYGFADSAQSIVPGVEQ